MWNYSTQGIAIKVEIYRPVQLSGLLTLHKVSHSFRIHSTQQTFVN
jgi:hypothetical protein